MFWRGILDDEFSILQFFFRQMWPEIHGLEVAERPGEEDLPPLEIPAWLSLDLHGRSERSTFRETASQMATSAPAPSETPTDLIMSLQRCRFVI